MDTVGRKVWSWIVGAAMVSAGWPALSPQVAGANVPGANGEIVFESTRDGNREIYRMEPDGSGQTRLTDQPGDDITPAWSPDGTRIVWSSRRSGSNGHDIYMMDRDGTGVVNLTAARTGSAQDRWPGFSPDGTEIVFMSTLNAGGNFDIYRMKLDGTGLTRLTFVGGIEECCASWSSVGDKIVFSTIRDGNFEIYIMNSDGSAQTNLTQHASYDGTPRFSADGTKITWRSSRSGNKIWVMNADGTNKVQVTSGGGVDRRPTFSPDGTKMLFTSTRTASGQTGSNDDIWVMNNNGTGLANLTNSPGEDIGAQWAVGDGSPPPPPPPPGDGYLTLMFGRSQWTSTDSNCQQLPGALNLGQVADALAQRGLAATGAIVVSYARESGRLCNGGFPVSYANWPDAAALRDDHDWTFLSAGKTYSDLTKLSVAQQRDKSCGSLPAFEQRGHNRAWGLFSYPNDKSNNQVQSQVVSDCFAYGRTYGDGTNVRSQLAPPWFQSTVSVDGGKCNNPAKACYTMQVGGGRRYDPPTELAALMNPGDNQWNVVQAYRLVAGSQSIGKWQWDCTSSDWRDHWANAIELYCMNDYLTVVDSIGPGTVVTDPATVAQAWGRGNP